MKQLLKHVNNIHLSSKTRPDVFIFGSARSGSTLMHEMITSQPGFKPIKVPFDLRYPPIAQYMREHGVNDWADYYEERATPVIEEYIKSIQSGKTHISDPYFFNNYNRWISRRIVFKLLHACEDRIQWFEDTFQGKIVYLLRHPIPVGFSRRQIPRLQTFVDSRFSRFFTKAQLAYAQGIIDNGSDMQKAVVDWAFQNSVSLRKAGDDWTIITYEQLVLNPEPIVDALCNNLSLSKPDDMMARLTSPSYSSKWSDDATNKVLNSLKADENNGVGDEHKQWLIYDKWKEKVSDEEEQQLMDILDVFELDFYKIGSAMPHERFWLK